MFYKAAIALVLTMSAPTSADIIYQNLSPLSYQVPAALNSDGLVVQQEVSDFVGVQVSAEVTGLIDLCIIEFSQLIAYQDILLFGANADIQFGSQTHPYPVITRKKAALPCGAVIGADLVQLVGVSEELQQQIKGAVLNSGKSGQ